MCNQWTVRSLAVVLVCALSVPAFAQTHGGLRLEALADHAAVSQPQTRPRDHDRDSLKNGAVIGAVVLGTWCLIVCGQGLDSSGQLPAAVAVNAGLGALIGATIDARFSRGPRLRFRWRF